MLDFDGTLADSAAWTLAALRTAAKKHKFRHLNDEDVDALRDRTSVEIIRHLGIPRWRLPFVVRDIRKMGTRADIALFDGTVPFLEGLHKAGQQTTIMSSNSEPTVRRILQGHVDKVDRFECGTALFGKERRLKRLIRRSGIHPSTVLVVGDETRDVEAANEVGAHSAAVTWGYASPMALQHSKPTYLVEGFRELLELALLA